MFKKNKFGDLKKILIPTLFVGLFLLSACGSSGNSNNAGQATSDLPTLNMEIPKSLTGGSTGNQKTSVVRAASSGLGIPCSFIGSDDDDIFQNGYRMTKFMVSAVAIWSCITDELISFSDLVAHDGIIYETENDTSAENYDPKDPTHFSVTDDSDSQVTIRLYYDYDRAAPPEPGDDPQFFVSWHETNDGVIEGRLIIDGLLIDPENRKTDDPIMMRMDFSETTSEKIADMFLRFDAGNPWAEGFRIEVTKDLGANVASEVFVARGMMEMNRQFLPVAGITEIPTIQMYTVSDHFGNGAAIADFQDLALALPLNPGTNNYLGNYLFTKNDRYFFDADGDWDWISKTISEAVFRGERTTPASGGTWIPFDPSLDVIVSGLALDTDYFTGSKCAGIGDNCLDLLNIIFSDGFADQEENQGSDPLDWRSSATENPVYLDSVYPNGEDWTDAFNFIFTPSLL